VHPDRQIAHSLIYQTPVFGSFPPLTGKISVSVIPIFRIAHMKAEDDALVRVKLMLDRVPDWERFLSQSGKCIEESSIKTNSLTGRSMGDAEFIQHL
jgi:hypothetical protein